MSQYLFLLGRNAPLSRAELNVFCEEILYDGTTGLLLGETAAEVDCEIFLDRLGGTVRMARVLGEYKSESDVLQEMAAQAHAQKPEGKIHLGISVFGMPQKKLRFLCPTVKTLLKEKFERSIRTVNHPGENLESGQIFGSKLLRKGFEFVIWHRGGSFLLAQTAANQDIEGYTIRDREKPFRDSKMGMLPPKLAQILVNLAVPQAPLSPAGSSPHKGVSEIGKVLDPFCGSGTIAIEASLRGLENFNSDLNPRFVLGAQQNFAAMSGRFGFAEDLADFKVSDALELPWKDMRGVVVTEGYLGTNFEKRPSPPQVRQQAVAVLSLWEKLFLKISEGSISTVCCCLPSWQQGAGAVGIAEKLYESVAPLGFRPDKVFDGQKSFVYKRDKAFVGREIVVFRKWLPGSDSNRRPIG